MSLPPPDPIPDRLPDDDLAALEAALDATTPGRIAGLLNGLQVAIWGLCLAVTATGGLALGFGLWAWASEPVAVVLVLAVAMPAIAIPLYVARRASALADAITHPAEVLVQARDLARGLTDGPELRALVSQLRRRGTRGGATSVGRIRRALRSGRLVVAVIGVAGPDQVRHPLLVPFTPERLRRLWLALVAGLWWWLAAAMLSVLALMVLVVTTLA